MSISKLSRKNLLRCQVPHTKKTSVLESNSSQLLITDSTSFIIFFTFFFALDTKIQGYSFLIILIKI